MLPVLYRFPDWIPLLGDQAITSFGALLLLAFLAAGMLFVRRLRRAAPGAAGWDLVVTAAIGGLIGAKLLHLGVHTALDLPAAGLGRGGLNWLGGLAGGAAAVAWHGRRLGLAPGVLAGAAAAPLALGYAIGRVGSFLVGADYGVPTALPWGVPFPGGTPPTTPANLAAVYGLDTPPGSRWGDFVRVHPTQLYSAALSLLTFGVLEWARRGIARAAAAVRGWRLFGLFLIFHGSGRAALELVRAKQDALMGPITVDLLLAVAALAAGLALTLRGTRT